MRLAFTLFHYFPYGGLERDMLAMARACVARGHQVTIYTQRWVGDQPDDIPVVIVPARALTNHSRARAFAQQFQALRAQETLDLVIGFNKMPGLDVYYAADVCFAQKAYEERGWLYRLSGRSRHYLALERAVFAPTSKTQILLISPAQVAPFQRYYQTPDERLHLLPPGIKRDRVMPADYAAQRQQWRSTFGLSPDTYLMLMVGSDFRRKGLARSIRALADLPEALRQRAQLWVAGDDDPKAFINLAQTLGVSKQLKVLGARDDIAQLLWSADVFLHPAHSEAAGAVLLEAMVAGLPVITTDVCGYAHYVAHQQQGRVITAAMADQQLAAVVAEVAACDPQLWRQLARDFIGSNDIFSMMDNAVGFIEQLGSGKSAPTLAG
jgi:UDP-glucose:(heptosyl)LPS alpha-1,3-glucosyltransferase